MKLRYKIYYNCYNMNYSNIAFYRYWDDGLPVGVYKKNLFCLFFGSSFKKITNRPLGIKIFY